MTDLLTRCLLRTMRGSSPSGSFFVDSALGFAWWLVWPIVRRYFDRVTARFGKRKQS